MAVTDENENIVEEATYSAFGEVANKTSSITNPFGYKGALGYYTNAETDDIYVRARTYEPKAARWLSLDPLHRSIGTNRYQYVLNNPILLVDPSGLICCVCHWRRQTLAENIGRLDADFAGQDQPYLALASGLARVFNNQAANFGLGPIPYPPPRSGLWHFLSPAKDIAINGYLFFISADVCETNPGDCLFSVNEHSKWLAKSSGGPFILQTNNPDGTPVNPQGPKYERPPATWADVLAGTAKPPFIGNLHPAAVYHPPCDKRIVWADLPHMVSSLGHPQFGTAIYAWGAHQDFAIYDNTGAPKATMNFKFSLWTGTALPLKASFHSAGSSFIPNRPECANCC